MSRPLWPRYSVTKLDAARKQLRVAISLWFQDGDGISIHTLAGAAHQIITDINRNRGGKGILFDSPIFKDEYRKQAIARLRKEINFFKHADEDPDGVIDFAPKMSEMFIMGALLGLETLGISHEPVEAAFITWFAFHHPELLTEKGRKYFVERLSAYDAINIKEMSPREYFERYLIVRERLSNIK